MAERHLALKTLIGVVALTAAFAGASAQDAKLALCGARVGGIYHLAAESIAQSLREPGLAVQVVETRGSRDNLKRMAQGDCDAAIVQLDALMIYSLEHVSRRLKITPPMRLYDEWLHLVCRRDSGIERVGDLLRSGNGYTLLIGEPDSGSETTWRALTGMDKDYGAIKTRALGGPEALAALAAGEAGDCMVVVIGPNSPFMADVDERGEALRLVPLDLFEFRDAELLENRIYSTAIIPASTYARLQAGLEPPEIETVAVPATLVVTKPWAKAHPKAYGKFRRAVAEALPAIRERLQPQAED